MDNETRNDTITTITTRTTADLDLGGDDELLETAPLAAYRRAKAHVAVDADLIPVDHEPAQRHPRHARGRYIIEAGILYKGRQCVPAQWEGLRVGVGDEQRGDGGRARRRHARL